MSVHRDTLDRLAKIDKLKDKNDFNVKMTKTTKKSEPTIGASKMPPLRDTAELTAMTTGRVVDAVLGALAGVVGGAAMGATTYGAQGIAGGLTGLATGNSEVSFDSKGQMNSTLNGKKKPYVPASEQTPVQNIEDIKEMMESIRKIIRVLGKKNGIDVDNPGELEVND